MNSSIWFWAGWIAAALAGYFAWGIKGFAVFSLTYTALHALLMAFKTL